VGGWKPCEIATARELLLGKKEQGPDLPAMSEKFRRGASGLIAEVLQQAGVGRAMPGARLRSGDQEAGTIKGAAPLHLQAANRRGGHRASGKGGNAAMLLDGEDSWHRGLADTEQECSCRFDWLLPLI
jgi:hypothetical protein